MKYTSLNQVSKPLDFRSQFTYSGKKQSDSIEEDYEPADYAPSFKSMGSRICECFLTCLSYFLFGILFPFSAFYTIKLVHQYERIIVYRLGHIQKPKGPGLIVILPCIDKWSKVDLRTKAFNVPPTNIKTSDGCIISIGACIHFRVRNPLKMSLSAQDVNHAVRDAARSSMSNLLCKRSFNDIKTKKQVEEHDIQVDVNLAAQEWGVEIGRVELSDISLIVAPAEKQSAFMPMYGAEPTPSNPTMDTLGQLAQIGQHFLMQRLQPPEPEVVPDPSSSAQQVSYKSADQLFEDVKNSLHSGLVKEVSATFQFAITDGGEYYLDLKNGSGHAGRGKIPGNEADVDIKVSSENLHKLMSGEMTPYTAYSSGRIKLQGDLRKAMRLDKVLEIINV